MANLNDYALPPEFDSLKARAQAVPLTPGVDNFSFGNDRGLACRFFKHAVRNFAREKAMKDSGGPDCALYDEIDYLEIIVDKYTKMHREASKEDKQRLKPLWDAYQSGANAPGLPLDKWGELTLAECKTLNDDGIYSVEQWIDRPKDMMNGRYPKELMDKWDLALGVVNSRKSTELLEKQSAEVGELRAELAELKALISGKAKKAAPEVKAAPKKGGRPAGSKNKKKTPGVVEEESIEA